jgi:hypothetical protein
MRKRWKKNHTPARHFEELLCHMERVGIGGTFRVVDSKFTSQPRKGSITGGKPHSLAAAHLCVDEILKEIARPKSVVSSALIPELYSTKGVELQNTGRHFRNTRVDTRLGEVRIVETDSRLPGGVEIELVLQRDEASISVYFGSFPVKPDQPKWLFPDDRDIRDDIHAWEPSVVNARLQARRELCARETRVEVDLRDEMARERAQGIIARAKDLHEARTNDPDFEFPFPSPPVPLA